MKINYLRVKDSNESEYMYQFKDKTMIYSEENSKGKTTLIRFILYSLGYQIPATEGIGDFDKMEFELNVTNKFKEITLFRKASNLQIIYEKKIYNYILPEQENELHSIIFGIDNVTVLNNLLAVYYIDQEKGWTLLNRGKIIGNIRFNIEEFIAGISKINIDNLLTEKRVLNNEIKKYRYIKNAVDVNSEFEEDDDDNSFEYNKYSMTELLQEQKEYEVKLRKIKSQRKKIETIINTNKGFSEMIENYGLIINHNGEEFLLTKDKLSDFDRNQEILKIKLNYYKIEEENINKKLDKILLIINEKNSLFETEDLLESMQKIIEKSGINIEQIDKILKQLINKRNVINKQIKEKLSFNNQQLYNFYETIVKYSKELNIFQYISDQTPRFVLTNKLKGLSGRVLAQMSYIFKLSYLKAIEDNFGIILPIIIDSPRTNELSEESTNSMMTILKRDFSNYQIITASIYQCKIIDFFTINLENGLMSKNFELGYNE